MGCPWCHAVYSGECPSGYGSHRCYYDAEGTPRPEEPDVALGIDWKQIETMPEDRKDGRQMLLWDYSGANVATWDARYCHWYSGYASELDGSPIAIEDATFWADINAPIELSGLT